MTTPISKRRSLNASSKERRKGGFIHLQFNLVQENKILQINVAIALYC